MTKELEALLTELYVLIDDQVVEPRHGRGRRPELSDSELLCLAVAQMLLGFHSERRWVRHAQRNADLRKMFPYMPQQPGYHKRLKASRGLLCNTIRVLARICPSWSDDLWITDATPVPCGTSREATVEGDEQVEALGLAHLADDDAGGTHPERLLDQAAQRYLTGALEAGLTALHRGNVAQRDLQLEDLLTGDHPFTRGDCRRQAVEHGRLACLGASIERYLWSPC